ncbi:MAG: mechanosensitive ion channel [Gammaproteobacteria bacterium]|nr:mechanosensitive ion channel [Gammaproteobacteria bacterium]
MQDILNLLNDYDWQQLLLHWGSRILIALAIFVVGRWVGKLLGRLIRNVVGKAGMDNLLAGFLGKLVSVAITAVALIAALDQVGVNTTSLVAVLGAAGLAIGLALQGSLSNFASSIMIMIFKPFRVGDFVDAGGTSGTIQEIGMFHTRLTTTDNQLIIVPNSAIMGGNIINYTINDTRRINETIGISYGDDPAKARELLFRIIRDDDRILSEPDPIVWLNQFGDSSVNLVIRCWTKTEDYWQTRADLLEAIKKAFDEHGISIPFPQRVIHQYSHSVD